MATTAKNFNNISDAEQILLRETLLVCTKRRVFPNVGIFYGENPLRYSFPLLMMEVTMVLLITHLIRFLLRPLRQPKVVCEILGGIIVGRSVLSSSNRFRKYIFPTDAIFVLKNIGMLGFMFFLFVAGVQVDVRLMKRAGRKTWIIAIFSVIIPLACSVLVGITFRKYMDEKLAKLPSIMGISALFSVTAFPVIGPIIKEFNLLSSEIGRLALSTTLITVVIGINSAVIFEAAQQGSVKSISALWSFLSFVVFTVSIFGGFRPAMYWIVKTTPQGKPIKEIYVIMILLGVMLAGIWADSFGMALCNGPMWLGLAVPDGPPLGATLVEKTEAIVNNILMPLGYIFVGMIVDLSSMSHNWLVLQPFLLMASTCCAVKLIATFMASHFLNMPTKDGLALSLIMSLRGQMELVMLIRFMDLQIITSPSFALLVLVILVVNAVATPVISILYDPKRPYMVNKRRNIQHNPPNSELRVVACLFDDRSVVGIINLLELSNSATASPISVYALHLVELIAQANSLLIEHDNEMRDSEQASYSSLHRALQRFQESRHQEIEIHKYTVMTAKRTMYQDICELALLKKASLILLPFDKELADLNTTSESLLMQRSVRLVNDDVLEHAPCSVAIFSNRGFSETHLNVSMTGSRHHVVVLFLGGADSREALTYADRISLNPNVCLTVIRFLSNEENSDDKMEKKLDDGLITWFWVKNESNGRVVYKEVVVANGEETIDAIQNLTADDCSLFIVGRKQGINPVILQGLSDWSENNELGVIGDYLISSDLGRSASLLVMQQQILRG